MGNSFDIKNYEYKLKKCLNYLYSNDDFKVCKALDYFQNGNYEDFKHYDTKIRILKGGSYKIKNYYLENNNLNDIRGASVLLTYVEENVIPEMISKKYSKDCIIYCGGGNIFAVLPDENKIEQDFNIKLEKEAQKYLISGNIAYYISESIALSKLLGEDYGKYMVEIENALDNRKKTKVYDNPSIESTLINKTIDISKSIKIDIKVDGYVKSTDICEHCNSKVARYLLNSDKICASCLHKNLVGKSTKNSKYSKEYEYYTHKLPKFAQSLENIDENYIAIVYGDGNNMGGIIQGLKTITEMMRFSETVKSVANKSVFESMREHNIEKFEVVGLGGDDVFVIVEAKKSIKFALSLIKKYNQDFKNKYPDSPSTMAVGIAIAKTNTPIKIVLEQAVEELSKAKKLCKKKVLNGLRDTGALSFTIINSYKGNNEDLKLNYNAKNTLLPYETETAEKIIKYVDSIKNSNISITKIYNLVESFKKAESIEEANLFFNYINAKDKKENRINLPKLNDVNANIDIQLDNAFYIKDDLKAYIWDNIINLLQYTDGSEIE